MIQGTKKTDCRKCWHCKEKRGEIFCNYEGAIQSSPIQKCLGYFPKDKPMDDANIRIYIAVAIDQDDQMKFSVAGSREEIAKCFNAEFSERFGEEVENEEGEKVKWEGFTAEDFREKMGTFNWDFRKTVCFDDGCIDICGMTVSLKCAQKSIERCRKSAIKRILKGKE